MTDSRPFTPMTLDSALGATSSVTPKAMEKYPRLLASLSFADCERPRSAVCGTRLCIIGSIHSRFQNYLDAAVLFVAECLVHLRPSFQGLRVRDDERGINLVFHHPVEQIVCPSIYMRLPCSDCKPLVHERADGQLVEQTSIHARD